MPRRLSVDIHVHNSPISGLHTPLHQTSPLSARPPPVLPRHRAMRRAGLVGGSLEQKTVQGTASAECLTLQAPLPHQ